MRSFMILHARQSMAHLLPANHAAWGMRRQLDLSA